MADASPDIRRRLLLIAVSVKHTLQWQLGCHWPYIVTDVWLPELDGLRGQSLNVSGIINEASSRGAGAHVDAYKVILLYNRVNSHCFRCRKHCWSIECWGRKGSPYIVLEVNDIACTSSVISHATDIKLTMPRGPAAVITPPLSLRTPW
jgi:hypothetical protein